MMSTAVMLRPRLSGRCERKHGSVLKKILYPRTGPLLRAPADRVPRYTQKLPGKAVYVGNRWMER